MLTYLAGLLTGSVLMLIAVRMKRFTNGEDGWWEHLTGRDWDLPEMHE